MANDTIDALTAFTWERQPSASRLVSQLLEKFVTANTDIARLSERLRDETGNRIGDWVDAFVVPVDWFSDLPNSLVETGFIDSGQNTWKHPEGIFPVVKLTESGSASLHVKVESVDDFAACYPVLAAKPRGKAGSAHRTLLVSEDNDTLLVAVERHGWSGFGFSSETDADIAAAREHLAVFCERKRHFADAEAGYAYTKKLIEDAVAEIGIDRACALFFAAERRYWQSRNHAAQVQFDRQQKLGLGWANHDHHTYRSSRACFHHLVEMLELLGFHCRERFYAGIEAGWGAQVLEQSGAGFVVFADVDMSPEEITGDFAHLGLPLRPELGTVGLWCQLHGEAFLSAGMHHLECQFDFDRARQQLADAGVNTMAPFTDFPHLRQAFTTGEIWKVDSVRIDVALSAGQISPQDAEQFRREGAIGSHLEILERNDGYKGFNQTGVSDIIARTDPRKW
ncbi:hypothetical protein [Bythopirellula polymerisocia]|uniref:Uncharacterized protein n=1 Tax=Bythopirellula polymerisocia TaxID=2528003 RepID=A0A5C6D024_9BACT|nr:hypothetical protein [Bythopirellula polymerisocia]TWU28556.1 hypothetical protein Pla144_18470 [Bythopirellula polymerisocia]